MSIEIKDGSPLMLMDDNPRCNQVNIRIAVYYSDLNDGYMYDVFDLDNYPQDTSEDEQESVRGGLCKGSPQDAVNMAIAEVKEYLATGITT